MGNELELGVACVADDEMRGVEFLANSVGIVAANFLPEQVDGHFLIVLLGQLMRRFRYCDHPAGVATAVVVILRYCLIIFSWSKN